MTTEQKLLALREIMERECIDAYIISGTDPHNSEYLPLAWKQREWISGFTGSFGTIVVTKDKAGLWTDTRYFIQAEKQLKGSGIQMHKLRVPDAVDYPEWLSAELPADSQVGLDCFCISVSEMNDLRQKLETKNIKVVGKTDLLGEIWLDRPALPSTPVFLVPDEVAGQTITDKLGTVRKVLTNKNADYFFFSSLDEIAWLYNIRCNDIAYNPVAISYAIVGKKQAYLFIKCPKVPVPIVKELRQHGVEIIDYHHLFLFLEETPKNSAFCIDTSSLNYAVYDKIASTFSVTEITSPVILSKSIKNPTEIAGMKMACIKDGVAMSKFLYWLESNMSNNISETEASAKLTALRAENQGYISDSFENISAYGENAALPHYSAIQGQDSVLKTSGLYLIDSGAQYTHGTTDITRTIALGELTYLQKEDYTLVLKGMIQLDRCIFPKGTRGCNLDIVARYSLWNKQRNFGHGTGHGIGFFLNVHEGPQSIRQDLKDQPFLPGMVTSDEPGIYREGSHGIRHENLILCVPKGINEFGEWYGFETLTICYFDTSAILPELLNEDEKEWLNAYHHTVYERISPMLTVEEAHWLAKKTKAI